MTEENLQCNPVGHTSEPSSLAHERALRISFIFKSLASQRALIVHRHRRWRVLLGLLSFLAQQRKEKPRGKPDSKNINSNEPASQVLLVLNTTINTLLVKGSGPDRVEPLDLLGNRSLSWCT